MKFPAALAAMRTYLQSPEFATREDAVDTQASLTTLLALNTAGLLTVSSQEGCVHETYDGALRRYDQERERAFVSGYAPRRRAEALVDYVNIHSSCVAWIVVCAAAADGISSIPVTVTGSRKRRRDWRGAEARTTLPYALPLTILRELEEDAHLDPGSALFLHVMDPRYGVRACDGVYPAVLAALAAVGK